ncbi:MAG: lipopolysaccharide biosynthesis protein [Marmoricola sp.]
MRSGFRDTTAPLIGSGVNGVLAYAVFAVTTHALGSEAAAPVSVLWSYWSFAGAALTFPVQHWATRTATAHGEGEVRRSLPRVSGVVLGLSLVTGVVAWALRDPLFHHGGLWWPLLVALVTLGSALIGLVRGGLSARGRFIGLTFSLGLESLVRCVGVVVLAELGVHHAIWYGVCLVIGHLTAFVWPSALRFRASGSETSAGSALAFLSSTASGQLLSQVVLTGGPVALALSGGRPGEVTALFAALALFRAPYVLALGAVAPLTARMTALVVAGRDAALRRFRVVVVATTVVGAVGAAVVGAVAGPFLLRLVFGSDVVIAAGLAAVVATGSLIAVANLVVVITAIAQNRPRILVLAWLVGCVAAVVVFALLSGQELERVVWAFFAAEVVAFVALLSVRDGVRTRSGGGSGRVSVTEPRM